MIKIIPLEEAIKIYAEYFQQNIYKCTEYTMLDECLFEAGKVAEYIGIMKKGACRRFIVNNQKTYRKEKGISYNFYYKHINTEPNLLGEPVIPPTSLLNNYPELFNLELIETKIITNPVALLMPMDVFRKDMAVNEKLANAVYSIIYSKLVNLAGRYIAERTIAHERQERIEYIAKLRAEKHHVFENFIKDIHACSYFGCRKSVYSTLIKDVEIYEREQSQKNKLC